jgi:hypothetical protein
MVDRFVSETIRPAVTWSGQVKNVYAADPAPDTSSILSRVAHHLEILNTVTNNPIFGRLHEQELGTLDRRARTVGKCVAIDDGLFRRPGGNGHLAVLREARYVHR